MWQWKKKLMKYLLLLQTAKFLDVLTNETHRTTYGNTQKQTLSLSHAKMRQTTKVRIACEKLK